MAAGGSLAAMSFRVFSDPVLSSRICAPLFLALALALGWAAPAPAQVTGPSPRRWDDPWTRPDPQAPDADEDGAPNARPPGLNERPPKAEPNTERRAGKPDAKSARKPAPTPAERLDQLYARLATAKDEAEAQGVSMRIERLLARAPSDTANLLMGRALVAATHDEKLLAEDVLDRILDLEPGWAEAWTRRAALRSARDDVSGAVADFGQALKIEPRHLGALNGLGFLLLRIERKDEALRVLKRALALNPHSEPAKKVAGKLETERTGQDL
jgi:tetratricopeptide (TPR) repeat protein